MREATRRHVRVLVVSHTAEPGGAELSLLRQAVLLRTRGVLLILCLGAEGPIAEMARQRGVPVHVLHLRRELMVRRRGQLRPFSDTLRFAPALAAAALAVARIAVRERVDVVSAFSMKAFAYGSLGAALAGRPLLWQLHDIPQAPYLSASGRLVFRVMLAAARPRMVLVPSHAVARTLRGVTAVVVPHGTHLRVSRSRGPTLQGNVRLGIAARIAEWKGQHVAVQAVAELRARGVDVQLMLAGAPWFGEEAYAKRLHRLVTQLGVEDRVRMLGHVHDVGRFFADIDVALHTSTLPEPFGNSVLEALAAGRPLVAADAGAVSEILAATDAALLTRPGDSTALAAAVEQLVREGEPRLQERGRAALQRARRFDERLEAARLARCFRAVALRRPPPSLELRARPVRPHHETPAS